MSQAPDTSRRQELERLEQEREALFARMYGPTARKRLAAAFAVSAAQVIALIGAVALYRQGPRLLPVAALLVGVAAAVFEWRFRRRIRACKARLDETQAAIDALRDQLQDINARP